HRVLVVPAAIGFRDGEGVLLVFGRPRNDPAGVVALVAPDAVGQVVPGARLRHHRNAQHPRRNQRPDHSALLNFCTRRPKPTSAVYRLPLESIAMLWTHLNCPGWRP